MLTLRKLLQTGFTFRMITVNGRRQRPYTQYERHGAYKVVLDNGVTTHWIPVDTEVTILTTTNGLFKIDMRHDIFLVSLKHKSFEGSVSYRDVIKTILRA